MDATRMDATGKPATYRLSNRGARLEIDTSVVDDRNHAELRVDGATVGEGSSDEIGHLDLRHDPHWVRVSWRWKGKVSRVELIERPTGAVDEPGEPEEWDPSAEWGPFAKKALRTPFEPPVGSRAHRKYAFQVAHPSLYAARHVAIQVGVLLVAVLGIGALLRSLLPRIPLPNITVPGWAQYLNPLYWLRQLFGWIGGWLPDWNLWGWLPDWDLPSLFGWLPDGLGKFWPVVVAIFVGVSEVDKRRKRDARERDIERDRGREAAEGQAGSAHDRGPDADR